MTWNSEGMSSVEIQSENESEKDLSALNKEADRTV
jgi:hypothetical protein